MISFEGTQRLYLKGICNVICNDDDGNVVYQSNKFNTGSITASVSLNEIRAGLGNPIAAIIPSDSALQVEFTAADFSLWAKAAQVGATLSYSAPAPKCETITASGTTISVTGSPVAQLGFSSAFCQVQEVGAASSVYGNGTAYAFGGANGKTVQGFTATPGKKYKVWYFTQDNNAQVATLGSMFDPKIVHFTAQMAVYSNEGTANEGTRVGWLYAVVPYLKLNADATITGDQANNDTTMISGQAIAYDASVVSEACSDCDQSTLAYYIYVPDNHTSNIKGLAVIGGSMTVPIGGEAYVPVKIVMADGSLVTPRDLSSTGGFTWATNPASSSSVSVNTEGKVTVSGSASTSTTVEVVGTYTGGYTVVANVNVVSA